MKNILITGANSYVGTSFEKWLSQWPDKYHVDTIDMIDGAWYARSFVGYDTVFHVAGIAHKKETKENAHLYYKVNRDIAIATARKAKIEGVRQFILMSSMSVYGMDTGVITKDTVPSPKTHYGKSKLEAEHGIVNLCDDTFQVAILRPPMIYGKGCKGNYQKLLKLVKITPVFPNIENKRSMIYIDNLSEFVRTLVDNLQHGLMFPQNEEYVCTAKFVEEIAKSYTKHIYFTQALNPVVRVLRKRMSIFNKIFGDLIYKETGSICRTVTFESSVRLSLQ